MFSCEYCEFFKNVCFEGLMRTGAFKNFKYSEKTSGVKFTWYVGYLIVNCRLSWTHFFSVCPYDPLENISKPQNSLYSQVEGGGQKGTYKGNGTISTFPVVIVEINFYIIIIIELHSSSRVGEFLSEKRRCFTVWWQSFIEEVINYYHDTNASTAQLIHESPIFPL